MIPLAVFVVVAVWAASAVLYGRASGNAHAAPRNVVRSDHSERRDRA